MADSEDIAKKLSELLEKQEEKEKSINTLIEQRIKKNQELLVIVEQGGTKGKNHLQIVGEMLANEEKILELSRQKVKLDKEELDIQLQNGKLSKEEYDRQKQILNDKQKELDIKEREFELDQKRNNAEKNTADILTKNLTSLTGISSQSKTFLGSMVELSAAGGNLRDSFAAVVNNIKNTFTLTNILVSAIDGIVGKTKQLFSAMDKSFAEFEKKAGGVDAFKGRIVELRDSNIEYALSIEEAGAAFSDLKSNFAGFAGVSATTQDSLAKTTAQMSKLGVASGETIKIQNMLVKGFQMSGEQAGNLQKQLMATAKSMGLPMQKVVEQFANASNGLRAQGSNMQKVFLDLQNQSKNLGIEFSRLQDITGKFDTFEGAADAAGQLNAMLGGDYLNSIQLLNADEGERVRLMQESLKASGRSFESMSKQEKMAAAQALGLNNVTELQQLMNNSVQEGTVEALNKAQAEKELAQSVKDVTTLQEKFTAIMAQFAVVLTPVLDLLKDILTPIGQMLSNNPAVIKTIMGLIFAFSALKVVFGAGGILEGFKKFRSAVTGAGGGIKGFIKALWQKITAQKAAAKATEELGDAQEKAAAKDDGGKKLGDTIKSIGEAAKNSWKEILAFGAAMLMIGGGIALAALGLSELVKAFAGLTGAEILGALGALIIVMGGFALMLYILTSAALPAALPLLALGAAFLMIGAGIAIAALGLSVLVKSFAGLGENAMPAALAVASLAGAMVLITYALIAAIPSTLAAGAAFAAAAPGILAFGAAVALIGVGIGVAAAGIGYMAKSVGDMFTALSKSDPKNISASFEALFDSLSITGVAKFASFATAADNLAESLDGINKNLSSMITKVSLINSLDFSPKINASPKMQTGAAVTNTVSTATAAATANNATSNGTGTTNIVPVAVYLDNKKIGEILDPKIKQTIQDSLKNINSKTVAVGI